MTESARTYTYTFTFPDDRTMVYPVALDGSSRCLNPCPAAPPEWARLGYHQCSPCTLTVARQPFCPVAGNIAELVTTFKNTTSYTRCLVTCRSDERTVSKNTSVQEGLASILGLLMATSGCPVLDFFRPMARFHLPFSSVDESIFRVVAMYMLRQYYRKNSDNRGDPLDEIRAHYSQVKLVNAGMLDRILHISALDADKNAIITLASLAQILEMELGTNLESLQHLFVDR